MGTKMKEEQREREREREGGFAQIGSEPQTEGYNSQYCTAKVQRGRQDKRRGKHLARLGGKPTDKWGKAGSQRRLASLGPTTNLG